MLKILSHITGSDRAERKDASCIYKKTMAQSRKPVFYGYGLAPDTTDGRMEILCMHMSTLMVALRGYGDNGAKLSQALYDVMIDDFDVALREEGLSDTGVSRRIKPLAKMFFERAKLYADAFDNKVDSEKEITKIMRKFICKDNKNVETCVIYITEFFSILQNNQLGHIAKANFDFPKFYK